MSEYNLGRVCPIFYGNWSAEMSYPYLSVVFFERGSYVAKGLVPVGVDPRNADYWCLVAQGDEITPEDFEEIVRLVIEKLGEVMVIDPDYVHTDNNLTDELVERINSAITEHQHLKTINGQEVVGEGNIEIEAGASDWNDIQNKPDFKAVATTGDYNDLENKPEIPENTPHWFGTQEEYDAIEEKDPNTIYHIEGGGGVSDWNDIQNKPDFKAVATSGDYNDLENKPDLKAVATSGDYNDLENKPEIPENTPHWFGTKAEYDAIEERDPNTIYHIEGGGSGSTNWDDIQNKPDFKAVATSGDYNDLENKPEIPDVSNVVRKGDSLEDNGLLMPRLLDHEASYDEETNTIHITHDKIRPNVPFWARFLFDIHDGMNLQVNDGDVKQLVFNYRSDFEYSIPKYRYVCIQITSGASYYHTILGVNWKQSDFATKNYVDEQIGNINSILENI